MPLPLLPPQTRCLPDRQAPLSRAATFGHRSNPQPHRNPGPTRRARQPPSNPTRKRNLTRLLPTLTLFFFTLPACAPNQHSDANASTFQQPLTIPPAFTDSDPDSTTSSSAATAPALPEQWWTVFNDPHLEQLQREALQRNFSLAIFRDRLDAARAIVDRERSALFPTINYSAFAQQTRESRNDFRSPDDLFGASLIGSYEIDVWGRNRAIVDSAEAARALAAEQLTAAAISLTADIALTWYALIEQRAQALVLEDQIETNETVLRVVRTRFGAGVVRAADVLRQQRLLESTLEQRAIVNERIETIAHALLVLIGRSPTESFEGSTTRSTTLPALPPIPALGLPSELLERRPDIRAAYIAIEGADAQLAVAIADRYPSIRIGAELSTVEEQLGDLLDNWLALISIDILGPLFDAGSREAEVRRAQAAKAETINAYAQTVLTAFRQVVDALAREDARNEQIFRLERQVDLARRTSERLNREYLNGDISFIDVLEALTTEQQLQRSLIAAQFERIAIRIDLYRALAGGWEGLIHDPQNPAAPPPPDNEVPTNPSDIQVNTNRTSHTPLAPTPTATPPTPQRPTETPQA
ncbi:MAG: efflux transporter outer membrane subunit [Phycisphaerales bacterium]